jgi:DegV family protein with EDD domain
MTLRIVTDSTADFEADEARDLGIEVVPLTVVFGDQALLDRVEITPEQFYRRLVESRITPKTSQPPVGRFAAAFERLAAEGATEILAICLSSRLSGTLGSAHLAAAGPPSGVRVETFDSMLVAGGLNALVRRAADLARAGATLDEVVHVLRAMLPRIQIHILLDTLEYLQRGGRIGRAQALLGGMLSIKPIVSVGDGQVGASERVRSRPRGIDRLYEHIVGLSDVERVIVQHTGAPDDALRLVARATSALPDAAVELRWIGPVVGVYTGPRGVGAVTVQRLP